MMIFNPFNGRLYAQYYEDDGIFIGVRKDLGGGTEMSILPNLASNHWQAFLAWNAAEATPLSLDNISVTPIPTPILDYAKPFLNNASLWVRLHKAIDNERSTFDISTASAVTILAKVRAQLKAVRAVIATAPQGVIDEFHRERVLQGSTTPLPFNDAAIDAMTVGECRICLSVARLVANQGLSIVTAINILNQ